MGGLKELRWTDAVVRTHAKYWDPSKIYDSSAGEDQNKRGYLVVCGRPRWCTMGDEISDPQMLFKCIALYGAEQKPRRMHYEYLTNANRSAQKVGGLQETREVLCWRARLWAFRLILTKCRRAEYNVGPQLSDRHCVLFPNQISQLTGFSLCFNVMSIVNHTFSMAHLAFLSKQTVHH